MRENKPFRAILFIILILVLRLLSLGYENQLRATFHIPEAYYELENENSWLLHMLIQKDIFSSDYLWYSIYTYQRSVSPVDANKSQVEVAHTSFEGYYNYSQIVIFQEVSRFNSDAVYEEEISLSNDPASGEKDLSTAQLINVALIQKSKCATFTDNKTKCKIVIVKDNILMKLNLDLNYLANESDIKEIIDPILEYIGNKISTIP